MLILAVPEVTGLDHALLDQRFQAIVDLPEADSEGFGELTLGQFGVVVQQFEDFVAVFVGQHLDGLPPYLVMTAQPGSGGSWSPSWARCSIGERMVRCTFGDFKDL